MRRKHLGEGWENAKVRGPLYLRGARRAVTATGDRDARAWDVQITRMLRDGPYRPAFRL